MNWWRVTIDESTFDVEINDGSITVDGSPLDASVILVGPDSYSILIEGKSYEASISKTPAGLLVTGIGRSSEAIVQNRVDLLIAESIDSDATSRSKEIVAPMPGLVLKIEVEEGETVSDHQGLIVLEAMKMENEILAKGDAEISQILVAEGETVQKDQVLLRFI